MNLNPFAKKKPAEQAPQLDSSYGPQGPQGPPGPPGPEGPAPPSGRIVPTDEVKALSSRGVPEPDIIRTLRREGYEKIRQSVFSINHRSNINNTSDGVTVRRGL